MFLIVISAATGRAQDKTAFPTEEETTLLVTQANRAVEQYKSAVDREELEFGKSYAEAVARDREVSKALDVVLKALRARPQGFNSPGGFGLLLWLDDADRNMLLCASGALSSSMASVTAGDSRKAKDLMGLAQVCSDTSTLLYTVSENAASLYQRYLEGEQQLAEKAYDTAQKCADALKKGGKAPKK